MGLFILYMPLHLRLRVERLILISYRKLRVSTKTLKSQQNQKDGNTLVCYCFYIAEQPEIDVKISSSIKTDIFIFSAPQIDFSSMAIK